MVHDVTGPTFTHNDAVSAPSQLKSWLGRTICKGNRLTALAIFVGVLIGVGAILGPIFSHAPHSGGVSM